MSHLAIAVNLGLDTLFTIIKIVHRRYCAMTWKSIILSTCCNNIETHRNNGTVKFVSWLLTTESVGRTDTRISSILFLTVWYFRYSRLSGYSKQYRHYRDTGDNWTILRIYSFLLYQQDEAARLNMIFSVAFGAYITCMFRYVFQ